MFVEDILLEVAPTTGALFSKSTYKVSTELAVSEPHLFFHTFHPHTKAGLHVAS